MLLQFRRLGYNVIALSLLISLVGVTIAVAANSGDLDTGFGGGTGKVITDFPGSINDTARGLLLTSDDKIFTVGDYRDPGDEDPFQIAEARYNLNGSPDTDFSGDGIAYVGAAAAQQGFEAAEVGLQYLISAQECTSGICDLSLWWVWSSSGGAAKVRSFDYGGSDNGTAGGLAIQPDGKIVVAGYMWNGDNYDFAVYRVSADGTLDTTFSGDGLQKIGFGTGRQDTAFDLSLRNGKIVVVGESCDSNYENCNFAVTRLKSNGALDTNFSGDGKQTTNLGASDTARAVAVQTDGKIVVAGEKVSPGQTNMAVVRYTSTGALDSSFSGDGKQIIKFGDSGGARDLRVQGTKIVVGGWAGNGTDSDLAVARLKANGGLDTSFNGDGKVLVDFGRYESAYALAIQPDGKYVLAGYTDVGGDRDFALARIWP